MLLRYRVVEVRVCLHIARRTRARVCIACRRRAMSTSCAFTVGPAPVRARIAVMRSGCDCGRNSRCDSRRGGRSVRRCSGRCTRRCRCRCRRRYSRRCVCLDAHMSSSVAGLGSTVARELTRTADRTPRTHRPAAVDISLVLILDAISAMLCRRLCGGTSGGCKSRHIGRGSGRRIRRRQSR